jgi:hypothetical protein
LNIAMQLTMDALVRSLRGMAHDAADRVEVRAAKRPPRLTRKAMLENDRRVRRDERRR